MVRDSQEDLKEAWASNNFHTDSLADAQARGALQNLAAIEMMIVGITMESENVAAIVEEDLSVLSPGVELR